MRVDLVRVTTRDGVQLDGMLRRPAENVRRAADVDVFCLVHGTGGNFYSSSLFDHLTERLLQLGCAVLRINTRGHDGISTAVTNKGGLRLGAAYEVVDDCRADLEGWARWLRAEVGPRICLLGHSLGAVKSIYAAAHETALAPTRLIAISPPRLSYSWFCASERAADFLATFQKAEALAGTDPAALLQVTIPLPFVITAAGYVEKYGPDERYNYLKYSPALRCPTLLLFGSVEVDKNVAFQKAPDEVARQGQKYQHLQVQTIPGADHFYTGVRDAAWQAIAGWLHGGAGSELA